MSFSSECKQELCRRAPQHDCCRLAELSGLYSVMGSLSLLGRGRVNVQFTGEDMAVCRRVYTLLVQTFRFSPQLHYTEHPRFGGRRKCVITLGPLQSPRLLAALGMMRGTEDNYSLVSPVPKLAVNKLCCMRAYLRGVFLGGGTMSAPEGDAHLELPCRRGEPQQTAARCMQRLDLPIHYAERRGHMYMYLKQHDQIVSLLRALGADQTVLKLEEIRVKRQVYSKVVRTVNCDNANLKKTLSAGENQLAMIRKLEAEGRLPSLPPALREIAEKRLASPEATLQELGEMLTPPVSKSGVNQRLRRLMALAAEPEKKEET